jgi:hypothetical protein
MSRKSRRKADEVVVRSPGADWCPASFVFFCAAEGCPGYTYRASEQAHPFGTCGSILCGADGADGGVSVTVPVVVAPVDDSPGQLSAVTPAPHVVNESAIGTSDMPPLNDASIEAEIPEFDGIDELPAADSRAVREEPPTREELFAQYKDALAALPSVPVQGEKIDVVIGGFQPDDEPPRPEVLVPRLVGDAGREAFLRVATTGLKVPIIGSCWTENEKPGHSCYEVLGINSDEDFALCDFHFAQDRTSAQVLLHLAFFVNGDLDVYLTRPAFFRDFGRVQTKTGTVLPMLHGLEQRGLRACPNLNTYVPEVGTWWCSATATEMLLRYVLAVNDEQEVTVTQFAELQVPRYETCRIRPFLDRSLRHFPPEGLPGWVREPSETPTAPRGDDAVDPVGLVSQHCNELALELGVEPLAVVRLFDGALVTLKSLVTMKELATTSPVVAAVISWLQRPETKGYTAPFLELLGSHVARVNAKQLDTVVAYINNDVEPRIEALEQAKRSADEVDVLRTASDEIRGRVTASGQNVQRESGKEVAKKAKQPQLPHMPPEPSEPPRRIRGRPRGTTVAAGAKSPRPGKTKNRAPASDMAARNKVSAKPKNKAKPIASKPAKPSYAQFSSVMGKDKNPKILALLGKIPPGNVDDFRKQSARGLPNMGALTNWNGKEKGTFAQWYFGR